MSDKLKDLIKALPEVEPKESADELMLKIFKREIRRLWEIRISLSAGIVSLFSGFLVIKKIVYLIELLDTKGFWLLVNSDKGWLSDKTGVSQAFLEAHPLAEIGYFLVLVIIFAVSLSILLKKD
ncbi:MAG: hypothetical protein M1514_01995 [Patescibacteria group bacterium]|nr:hypothetical protein [Patescibacteria group bacterium]